MNILIWLIVILQAATILVLADQLNKLAVRVASLEAEAAQRVVAPLPGDTVDVKRRLDMHEVKLSTLWRTVCTAEPRARGYVQQDM